MPLNFFIVVGTHHKTGTVWMREVFRSIAKAFDVAFIRLKKNSALGPDRSYIPSVIFSDHSDFSRNKNLLLHPKGRVFHLVRDPRDVIISAMHYHRHARERWLHKRRKTFNGLTYQEYSNTLENDNSRYLFEMRNSAARVIDAMRNWDFTIPNSVECRYEDLIVDFEGVLFADIAERLGFRGDEIECCRRLFIENSMFSSSAPEASVHIRSGKSKQWKTTFDQNLATEFLNTFGDTLIKLGYEPDNSWVDELPLRKLELAE